MCILILAVEVSGDQLSAINMLGLVLCLMGIIGHIVHKVLLIQAVTGTVRALKEDFEPVGKVRGLKRDGEHNKPLLDEQKWDGSDDSDPDANIVLREVLQRRDGQ